jgi:hypothetical protein
MVSTTAVIGRVARTGGWRAGGRVLRVTADNGITGSRGRTVSVDSVVIAGSVRRHVPVPE